MWVLLHFQPPLFEKPHVSRTKTCSANKNTGSFETQQRHRTTNGNQSLTIQNQFTIARRNADYENFTLVNVNFNWPNVLFVFWFNVFY